MTEMNDPKHNLEQIQNWLQTVITHPDGVETGVASEEARQLINVGAENIEQIITRSKSLDSFSRLHVYGNAYYARLLECLGEEYPTVKHAAGEETFQAIAIGYLQSHPSKSYTLGELGKDFSNYLQEIRPEKDPDSNQPDWADFIVDLAILEKIYGEVFDGPGVEEVSLLDAGKLQSISPEAWPGCRFEFAPCFRLLKLRFPIHEYVTAVRQQKQPQPPEPEETYLAITRRNYIVRRRAINRNQFLLLQSLFANTSIGESIEQLAGEHEIDASDFAELLQQWFSAWTAAGYFLQVVPTEKSL